MNTQTHWPTLDQYNHLEGLLNLYVLLGLISRNTRSRVLSNFINRIMSTSSAKAYAS